uniref:Uncharacterized protein n=1 Tax=Rhipicephalus appendiculatus TaxID=34631 RepID=A0A131Z4H3_RHIAP
MAKISSLHFVVLVAALVFILATFQEEGTLLATAQPVPKNNGADKPKERRRRRRRGLNCRNPKAIPCSPFGPRSGPASDD